VKNKLSFRLNFRSVLLLAGFVTLAGNALLATKIWSLWLLLISVFFSVMDIYHAVYSMLDQALS
jgi:hypothetical protein